MNRLLTLQNQSPSLPFTDFQLTVGTYLLGRSSKCDVVVKHKSVSRRHAKIRVANDQAIVLDLDSRNGTFLDDRLVGRCEVKAGQQLRFGSVSFLVMETMPESEELNSAVETDRCREARTLAWDIAVALLSKAQRRVFNLLLSRLTEKEIAAKLALSPHTVHNHIEAIYRILDVHSRAELFTRFLSTERG